MISFSSCNVVDYDAIEIRLFSYRSEKIWPRCICICINYNMNYEFRIKMKCLIFVIALDILPDLCIFVNMTICEVIFVDSIIVECIVYSVW